jgi:hypothetical protein
MVGPAVHWINWKYRRRGFVFFEARSLAGFRKRSHRAWELMQLHLMRLLEALAHAPP